ncbi:MAG: type III PLP-dependent enzyme, partial [Acidaminococcaceae bacterium]
MKRHGFFQLTEHSVKLLAENYETPLLVLSLDQIEKNYCFLKTNLPKVKLYYAMKANPDLHILEKMIALGSCFDVASEGEIRTLAG